MGRDSPVLTVIVFVGEVLFMVSEVRVKLEALFEVLNRLEAANVLQKIKVAVCVDASTDKSVPVDALELNIRVVNLE